MSFAIGVHDPLAAQGLHGHLPVCAQEDAHRPRGLRPRPPRPGWPPAPATPAPSTSSLRVSGPRELLSTTSYPAATASLATVPPMFSAADEAHSCQDRKSVV